MSLDDIIKKGKEDIKMEEISGDFRENPWQNMYSEIIKLDGSDKWMKDFGLEGLTEERMAKLSSVQTNDLISFIKEGIQNDIIKKVQESYDDALKKLGEGNKGMDKLSGVISQAKPIEYTGINEDVYKSHKKVYSSFEDARNPINGFKKLIEDKKDTIGGRILMYLSQIDNSLPVYVMQNKLESDRKKFAEKLENIANATEYFDGQYKNADDKTKKGLAYGIGRGLAA